MNMRFEIGQQAYLATWGTQQSSVVCPDCGGTGRLRVTFHDETQVSIECQNCSVGGYDPPSGRVRVYERQARADVVTIVGFRIEGAKTEWQTTGSYFVSDDDLFIDRETCMARAELRAAKADREERDRINKKEKNTRTWAWNASYHRKCIKDAEKQIEYHSKKLAVAAIKAKEDKAKVA